MGSEMCIRDRGLAQPAQGLGSPYGGLYWNGTLAIHGALIRDLALKWGPNRPSQGPIWALLGGPSGGPSGQAWAVGPYEAVQIGPGLARAWPKGLQKGVQKGLLEALFRALIWRVNRPKSRVWPSGSPLFPSHIGPHMGPQEAYLGGPSGGLLGGPGPEAPMRQFKSAHCWPGPGQKGSKRGSKWAYLGPYLGPILGG